MPSVDGVSTRPALRPSATTVAAVLLVVALRAPFLGALAYPDEGGLLLVARGWGRGGTGLYGRLWVDRPPVLMLFWKVAASLGGVSPARVLALLDVVALVLAAVWVGRIVAGGRGARWAAVVAAALSCSPLLGADEVDAELLAAPLVLVACGAALRATSRSAAPPAPTRAGWALLAGASGATALLVKQNLADGLVFAAVLVAASALTGGCSWRAALRVFALGLVGSLVPVALTVLWVVSDGAGVGELFSTLFAFRVRADEVIAGASGAAPESRLLVLLVAGAASGLLALLVASALSLRAPRRSRGPVEAAVAAMLVFGLVSLAAGGSFWRHYLLELVPVAVLAVALLAARSWHPGAARSLIALSVVSAVVASGVLLLDDGYRSDQRALVAWLAAARRPDDTALVTYGHADIVEASGLRAAAYPYVWSLPLRTWDPDLSRLTRALASPRAPVWLVEWNGFDSWGLDAHGRLAALVGRRYREVGPVCGVPVYLRRDQPRTLPSSVTC